MTEQNMPVNAYAMAQKGRASGSFAESAAVPNPCALQQIPEHSSFDSVTYMKKLSKKNLISTKREQNLMDAYIHTWLDWKFQ